MSDMKLLFGEETVYIPRFFLSDVIRGAEHIPHPAFVTERGVLRGFYVSKYLCSLSDGKAVSRRGADPATHIDFDEAARLSAEKGEGFHLLTAAEWSAIALLCRKNGFLPYGNTADGKDIRETEYTATVSYRNDEKGIVRTATGSGPVTWNHNGREDGIADLAGNVWEWNDGIRLVHGEVQIIPQRTTAIPSAADSDAFRVIDGLSGELCIPKGDGQTENAVHLDYSDGWVFRTAPAKNVHSGARFCAYGKVRAEGLCARAEQLLRAYTLLPEGDAAAYEGVDFYANNGASERMVFRGGRWGQGVNTGLFKTCIDDPRTFCGDAVGFRYAYVDASDLLL